VLDCDLPHGQVNERLDGGPELRRRREYWRRKSRTAEQKGDSRRK
jgi:hypothetical protein